MDSIIDWGITLEPKTNLAKYKLQETMWTSLRGKKAAAGGGLARQLGAAVPPILCYIDLTCSILQGRGWAPVMWSEKSVTADWCQRERCCWQTFSPFTIVVNRPPATLQLTQSKAQRTQISVKIWAAYRPQPVLYTTWALKFAVKSPNISAKVVQLKFVATMWA